MEYSRKSPSTNKLYNIGKTTRKNFELSEYGLISEKEIMQKFAYFYYMEEKSKYMYFINANDYYIIEKFIKLKNRILYLKIENKEDLEALKNSNLKNLVVLRINNFNDLDFKSWQEISKRIKVLGIEVLNIGINKLLYLDSYKFVEAKKRYNQILKIIDKKVYVKRKNIESIIVEGHTSPYTFCEVCTMPKELKQFLQDNNIPICIELKSQADMEKLKQRVNERKFKEEIILASEYVSNISPSDIEELKKHLKIRGILIGKKENENQEKMEIEVYNDIYSKLNTLIKGINIEEGFFKKFDKIYRRIIKNIKYDFNEKKDNDLYNEKDQIYSYKNVNSSRNLINGLIYKETVCVGYAEILKQALSLVNIKAKTISGEVPNSEEDERYHAWNIVLDSKTKKWYNCDITWDSGTEKKIEWQLLSDDNFVNHFTDEKHEKCNNDYKIGIFDKIRTFPANIIYRYKNRFQNIKENIGKIIMCKDNESMFLDGKSIALDSKESFFESLNFRDTKVKMPIMSSVATRNNDKNIER